MGRLTHRTTPGFTYFVTTKAWQNQAVFQVRENAEILVGCLAHYRGQGFYLLHEFVVMPNHLHLILTPAVNASLEKAMQLIKGRSSHDIHEQRGGKAPIWHSGFHEESIRNQGDYSRKAEYIQMNPVRAHLVERPEDWPYSSIAKRVELDPTPERLKRSSSGAKAPFLAEAGMSELKLRPPKDPG
ncbi:MAG: REP-associated tyrosine transposase [Candidatus Acidiferrales bacterium]